MKRSDFLKALGALIPLPLASGVLTGITAADPETEPHRVGPVLGKSITDLRDISDLMRRVHDELWRSFCQRYRDP